MDPKKLFLDERLRGLCANCGASNPDTQDHNPSKVFLDRPYPKLIPTVQMCRTYNESYSLDEQYVACLIECAKSGFESLDAIQRPNIWNILSKNPKLSGLISRARSLTFGGIPTFQIDTQRVVNVLTKLARGHINYELSNVMSSPPYSIGFAPVPSLSQEQCENFVAELQPGTWPEIGSRLFHSVAVSFPDSMISDGWGNWKVIQPNRYQYMIQ